MIRGRGIIDRQRVRLKEGRERKRERQKDRR